jgi:spermidine synthase
MRIILSKLISESDFIELYKSAGWWLDEYDTDTSFIKKIIDGSFLFAVAYNDSGKAVGMGRVISDSVSDAYIQDVVVLHEYRKKGIGAGIINLLLAELKEKGIDWIGLIGEPGTESFYKSLGFSTLKKYIPMKFEN